LIDLISTHIDQRPFRIVKDDGLKYYLIRCPSCSRYQSVQCKPCEEPGYLDLPMDDFLIAVLLEGTHSTAPSRMSKLSRRVHKSECYHKDAKVRGWSTCMLKVVQRRIGNRF